MRKVFIKYDSKQTIEGQNAYSRGLDMSSNPYDPLKQPAFYSRWRTGYLEYRTIVRNAGSVFK